MVRIIVIVMMILCLCGCTAKVTEPEPASESAGVYEYVQISQQEAKTMMDEYADSVILDVREQDEFDAGHIPGAVLLPVGSIDEVSAAAVIPAKDTVVLVYCRSGNRSKTASAALVKLGYSNVYEFGGIIDWPYEIEQ